MGIMSLSVACSFFGSESEGEYSDDFYGDGEFIVDADDDLFLDSDMDFDPLFEDDFMDGGPVISDGPSPGIGEYHVKKGDTLLQIAFNIYGNYNRWKDISRVNGGITHVSEGQVLQYEMPAERFVWNPQGNPHVIQRGETLGTISQDKYGTTSRWKSIYENNRPMIQDPNLIFAGFTLYYIPDRNIASENDGFDF